VRRAIVEPGFGWGAPGASSGMSEHRHGEIGVCSRCHCVRALAEGATCHPCRRSDDREVERLLTSWGRDLDLLERFDAFCAGRRVTP
jgi:hypothetical protein